MVATSSRRHMIRIGDEATLELPVRAKRSGHERHVRSTGIDSAGRSNIAVDRALSAQSLVNGAATPLHRFVSSPQNLQPGASRRGRPCCGRTTGVCGESQHLTGKGAICDGPGRRSRKAVRENAFASSAAPLTPPTAHPRSGTSRSLAATGLEPIGAVADSFGLPVWKPKRFRSSASGRTLLWLRADDVRVSRGVFPDQSNRP